MLQKGVEYNQKLNYSLGYPHLTVKFSRVSLVEIIENKIREFRFNEVVDLEPC